MAQRSKEEQAPPCLHSGAMNFSRIGLSIPQLLGFVWQNHTFLPINVHRFLAFDFSYSQEQTQGVFSKVTRAAAEIIISRVKTCLPCSRNSEQQSRLSSLEIVLKSSQGLRSLWKKIFQMILATCDRCQPLFNTVRALVPH